MFMQEKEEREAARKARKEKDQDVVEVTPPTSVTPGATEIKQ
jgi:hypothetical protein